MFMEDEKWDCNLENERGKAPANLQPNKDDVDDHPIRGTKPLVDIFSRCNVAVMELIGVQEDMQDRKWLSAMKEELSMIEKNKTWKLVQRPLYKKVIGVKWVFQIKKQC